MKKQDISKLPLSELLRYRNKKRNQVARMRADLRQRKMNISEMMVMNNDLQKVRDAFFAQTPIFELNNILYPFQYQTSLVEVASANAAVSKISVSAEASFIITEIQAVVFDIVAGVPTYVNPEDYGSAGVIDGLKASIRDLSSERSMMEQPVSIDSLGNYVTPVKLDDPFYVDPNQSLEVQFTNQSQTKTYVPSVIFKGYRLRIEDANSLIQKVTA
jgi:hypothetical protein